MNLPAVIDYHRSPEDLLPTVMRDNIHAIIEELRGEGYFIAFSLCGFLDIGRIRHAKRKDSKGNLACPLVVHAQLEWEEHMRGVSSQEAPFKNETAGELHFSRIKETGKHLLMCAADNSIHPKLKVKSHYNESARAIQKLVGCNKQEAIELVAYIRGQLLTLVVPTVLT